MKRKIAAALAALALSTVLSGCMMRAPTGTVNFGVDIDSAGKPTIGISGTFELGNSLNETDPVSEPEIPPEIHSGEKTAAAVSRMGLIGDIVSGFGSSRSQSAAPLGLVSCTVALDEEQAAVASIVIKVAEAAGIPPLDFLAVAWIELRLRPGAKNLHSSASGVFQFLSVTARDYGLVNPFDARANIEASARLWNANKRFLIRELGRVPTGAEQYLAHQQGAGGALKLIRAGHASAASAVGHTEIALNTDRGADLSAAAFVADWAAKFLWARALFTLG